VRISAVHTGKPGTKFLILTLILSQIVDAGKVHTARTDFKAFVGVSVAIVSAPDAAIVVAEPKLFVDQFIRSTGRC